MVARYEALAADAARRGAVLMVWPETATASEIEMPGMVPRLAAVAARIHAAQVVGALSRDAAGRYANGAFVVTGAGLAGGYRKMHLVPFGEYMPAWARSVLPFVRKLTEGMDDLVPGADPEPLAVPGMPGVRLGVFVCYEAVFPGTGRDRAARCATLFVNVTNDAWYHDSAATSQHALGPVARAVEGGRWIIRAANTGLSFVAGPDGRLVTGPGLSQPGIVVADVVPPADACLQTGFVRWGGVPLALYAVAAFAAAWRRRARPA
jgi:apolipoprotein N-acyltransferase